ncbi:protein FAR1-RELATED SEQUENCE 5-like [Henckelia pumila]|uniref:protein FAR1-RELATED SEQUENCE 5-like n=1 Tax=Henckelia pumila TaxID=405737 RepID=UPI003C6E3739
MSKPGALNSKNDGVVNDVHLFAEDIEIEPKVGMKFENENEVFDFYKRYAYHVGFPVRKRTSRKNKEGVVTYIAFTCGRESRINSNTSTTMKPQPIGQTGCKARLTACSDVAGVWKITGVHLEHNHQTSPTKSRVRKLRLGEGDAAAIQAYFSKMQSLSPGFFFSLDLDDEGRLKNIFWADNRCRQAYKEFGDVITFDTTYLTNKYDMTFAPFIGVNHHGHSTLLGCGLLSSEDTETFVWLFKIWLECMKFKSPQGIITDQDRAMQNAIEAVFPNSKHRWCLWHILKKLPEKFGYHCQKASILSSIHELVYESQSTNEFEQDWFSMLDMYELQNNDWLIGLFRKRTRWVPCFLRTSFWAGMSTTQ